MAMFNKFPAMFQKLAHKTLLWKLANQAVFLRVCALLIYENEWKCSERECNFFRSNHDVDFLINRSEITLEIRKIMKSGACNRVDLGFGCTHTKRVAVLNTDKFQRLKKTQVSHTSLD